MKSAHRHLRLPVHDKSAGTVFISEMSNGSDML